MARGKKKGGNRIRGAGKRTATGKFAGKSASGKTKSSR